MNKSELTAHQRALRARIAANERVARPGYDPHEATRPATQAHWARCYDLVDPDRNIAPEERTRRAKAKWQADMARARLAKSRSSHKR
jgi:hypothetical protein